jgi:hypothetical protein
MIIMDSVLSANGLAILRSRTFAHVALTDNSGRPHVTPVWVDVDAQGRPWFNTIVGRVKDLRLPLGAPVGLSATAADDGYLWVSVQGRVIEKRLEGADADIHALAAKYRGAGARANINPGETRVTIVIEPEAERGGRPPAGPRTQV